MFADATRAQAPWTERYWIPVDFVRKRVSVVVLAVASRPVPPQPTYAAITVLNVLAAEVTKSWFYRSTS